MKYDAHGIPHGEGIENQIRFEDKFSFKRQV